MTKGATTADLRIDICGARFLIITAAAAAR